ncbi:MAG: outer membrane lipoprotein carrier protein LolA [Prevotellaceae bacterium]|jgi:outer membrane lipoprotein carrier protein|nr:outer membrane lipoprotein carrier protein LolA [Prevotellaceae bacterium]
MAQIKNIFLAALMLACCANAGAQDEAAAAQEEQLLTLQQIAAASAGMKSLICDFEQTKVMSMLNDKLVSTGKMYYRRDGCLRWEYAPPAEYTFILNNKKALMLAGGKRISDAKMNRFFQEMIGVMMNGINGSGLTDKNTFEVSYQRSTEQFEVVLLPVRREVKKMFASITLTFNLKDYTTDRIALKESNGDVTTIRLLEKQLNVEIDDAKFNTN